MKAYDSVLDALNGLKKRGFTLDYKLSKDCLKCSKRGRLDPHEFEIKEVHRFEGMSNPDDNAVVYAIQSRHGDKGTLVDAYGAYADSTSTAMLEKLRISH